MLAQRLFVWGLIVTGSFGLAHFTGFLRGAYLARHDPNLAGLTRDMRAHRTHLLGFHPSLLDFREYFSVNFTILMLLASGLGFAALGAADDNTAVIHTLSPVYAGAMLLLLGTSLRYSVVQGIVTCPAIAILFGLAWRLSSGPS